MLAGNGSFATHCKSTTLVRGFREKALHGVPYLCLVGTVSNFCTPHASVSQAQKTTPAMAAGITDYCWTMHELLSFHVPLSRWVPPKRRGRPARALQHLLERWCS